MSTFVSDAQLGEVRDERGAQIDVADSLASDCVRLSIEEQRVLGPYEISIELTVEQAEKVIAAMERSVGNVRQGFRNDY